MLFAIAGLALAPGRPPRFIKGAFWGRQFSSCIHSLPEQVAARLSSRRFPVGLFIELGATSTPLPSRQVGEACIFIFGFWVNPASGHAIRVTGIGQATLLASHGRAITVSYTGHNSLVFGPSEQKRPVITP